MQSDNPESGTDFQPTLDFRMRQMPRVPHIAMLVETSREYARGLLRGISRYHQEHGPWSIYFEPHGLNDPPPTWLRDWQGDGILARIDNQQTADVILATGLPAVDVRGALEDLPIPFVGLDNQPICELAFEHLKHCGLRNFAFCGTPRGENPNQDRRCDIFAELVAAQGEKCHLYLGGKGRSKKWTWETEQQELAKWLQRLPKPVGVMTCHDDRGYQTLDACRRAGVQVPEEVAVVSVDNDPHLCNLCTPPLTSVDVFPSRVGYEAASLLMRLMDGQPCPNEAVLLGPPRGLVPRQSSDVLSIDDEDVAAALRLIRRSASHGISVRDVITATRRSPSTLERRFKAKVGRTIKAEITRERLHRAKLLLQETDLPVATIAIRAGFSESKYFCEVFRKFTGMTALSFRATFRE